MSETGLTDVFARVRADIRRTWVMGGVLPLVGFLLLVLVIGRYELGYQGLTQHRIDATFEAILAISAVVFLVAFSLDSYWTSPERSGAAVERSGVADAPVPAAQQTADAMRDTSSALTLMGNAIGAAAVLAAYTTGDWKYGLQLLGMAVCYLVFFLSRHGHYFQLVEAAAEGTLLAPPEPSPATNPPQEAHDDAPS